jgi:hypothetical protein
VAAAIQAVETEQAALKEVLSATKAAVARATAALAAGRADAAALSDLQQLVVVTREERALVFLQHAQDVLPQLQELSTTTTGAGAGAGDAAGAGAGVAVPLSRAQALLARAEGLIAEGAADAFPPTKELKGKLRAAHGRLQDDVSAAETRWSRVRGDLQRQGGIDTHAVAPAAVAASPRAAFAALEAPQLTAEALASLLGKAAGTMFACAEVEAEAQQAQHKAADVATRAVAELSAMDAATPSALDKVRLRALLRPYFHHPSLNAASSSSSSDPLNPQSGSATAAGSVAPARARHRRRGRETGACVAIVCHPAHSRQGSHCATHVPSRSFPLTLAPLAFLV